MTETETDTDSTTGSASAGTLSVDADRCTGHGRCYGVAPDLLTDDEEGFVTLRGSSMPLSVAQLADGEEAATACPERAITLTRSS